MGKPYSEDLRVRVVAAMEDGQSCRAAGALFGVAPSTAGNWHRLYRRTHSVAARPMGGDHRSKLTEHADEVRRLLEGSDLRLVDVRDTLAAQGVVVGTSTVQRIVKRLGLRFKKNAVCH